MDFGGIHECDAFVDRLFFLFDFEFRFEFFFFLFSFWNRVVDFFFGNSSA